MPTGYTAPIKDGITFEQFIWRCARNFGALIEMRDAPMDAPVPEKFEVSPYHHDETEKALDKMRELAEMSEEELEAAAQKDYEEELEYRVRRDADNALLMKAYSDMLQQAESWEPPTDEHQGLKDFMTRQIKESISFDGMGKSSEPEAKRRTGQEWLQIEISKCLRDVDYHTEASIEEIARVEKRNLWIKQLRESLE